MVLFPGQFSTREVTTAVPVFTLESAVESGVAEYAAVADPELVRRRGLFVAEGRLVVRRLIERGRCRIRSLLVNEAALHELGPALERLDPSVPVYVGPGRLFHDITGFNIHRGCLALAERPPATPPATLLHDARMILLLESIANPDNVGGIFRNAAAFGVDAVLLNAATSDPLYRKTIRTSMGASLDVPFATLAWPRDLVVVRDAGLTIAALSAREPAETIDRFAERHRGSRLALLLGNEGEGLSPEALGLADYRVRIPTAGRVDSLNVAVAAGIALARLTDFAPV
jgi:tRNA G18 (ribose-2'-O)-methylase SpoU